MNVATLVGQRFGELVALEQTKHKGRTAYICQCDCGATKVMRADTLKAGVKTCKIAGRHDVELVATPGFYGPLVSRMKAQKKGYKWYVSGRACENGHFCERQTANGRCRLCWAEKNADNCRRWYQESGRDQVIKQSKEWAKANPDKRKDTVNRHNRKVMATPQGKIKRACRRRVINALTAKGLVKSQLTEELVGCSIEHLAQHIEAQFTVDMTWENYGLATWHVDHIRPCESFDLEDPAQRAICFNWRNQQPLSAAENMAKKDRWTEEMEQEWVDHMQGLGWTGDLSLVFASAKLAA